MRRPYQMDGRRPNTGALDFSGLLDPPAGRHGFLQAKGERLIFEDGTPLRVFGTSMVGLGCCPDHDTAEAVAARVASAGLNLVRMHYADGSLTLGDQTTEGGLIDYSSGSSRVLSEDGLERLDYFIAQLNSRGVYVQLDTFVGRNFKPEGDGLDYPDTFPESWAIKEVSIFNRRMIELQKEYDRALLGHVNRYKGLRYADDPGIAVVQVMNENSLLWDFGADFNITMIPPGYQKELRERWRAFLKQKYGTQEGLRKAWTNQDGVCALLEMEEIDYRVEIPTDPYFTNRPVGTAHTTPYRSVNSPVRTRDYLAFLMELENSFNKEMYDFLRGELGLKCCINTTNLIRGAANAYTANLYCDLAENDAYYNHPRYGFAPPASCHTTPMYTTDPREAGTTANTGHLVSQLARANAAGKPMVVAEWNDTFPTGFSSEAMYMMAGYGALNEWAGMCCFLYNNKREFLHLGYDHLDFYFTIYNNPSMFGEIGVCSAAFQKGLIRPARNTIDLVYSGEDLLANDPDTCDIPFCALPYVSRTRLAFTDRYAGDAQLAISGGFVPAGDLTGARHAIVFAQSPYQNAAQKQEGREAWLGRHLEKDARPLEGVGMAGGRRAVAADAGPFAQSPREYADTVGRAMRHWGLLEPEQGFFEDRLVSDTGEICFDTKRRVFTIHAAQFAVYAGDVCAPFVLGGLTFALDNPRMSVSMLSLDDLPLEESGRILITAVGDCCNTDMQRSGDRLLDMGHGPVWIDQIEGCLTVGRPQAGVTLFALAPDGQRAEELGQENSGNGVRFCFATQQAAIHFELVRTTINNKNGGGFL